MKEYSILQKKVDYDYFLQLRENGVLPLLVTLKSKEDLHPLISTLYELSCLTEELNEVVYEMDSMKLYKQNKTKKIKTKKIVLLDEYSYRIEDIEPGNLGINSGGFDIEEIGYKSMGELNKEIVESKNNNEENKHVYIKK